MTGLGLGALGFLLQKINIHLFWETLKHGATYFPFILLLEISILACTMAALRALYGPDQRNIPAKALVQAGLTSYAIMGIVPAGRAFAEATRATLLTRYSNSARAAAAATQLQAVSLLANATISVPAALAMHFKPGNTINTSLIFSNGLLTLFLGSMILLAAQFAKVGKNLGRFFPKLTDFAQRFDTHLLLSRQTFYAYLWELLGRGIQVLQNSILVLAVGGTFGLGYALRSEALHLIGVAGGEMIPAQLGATELTFKLSASALDMFPETAISIAILAHLAQFFWVSIGALMPIIFQKNGPASIEQ